MAAATSSSTETSVRTKRTAAPSSSTRSPPGPSWRSATITTGAFGGEPTDRCLADPGGAAGDHATLPSSCGSRCLPRQVADEAMSTNAPVSKRCNAGSLARRLARRRRPRRASHTLLRSRPCGRAPRGRRAAGGHRPRWSCASDLDDLSRPGRAERVAASPGARWEGTRRRGHRLSHVPASSSGAASPGPQKPIASR